MTGNENHEQPNIATDTGPDLACQEQPPSIAGAFEDVAINKIEVLNSRCVPGSDGALEHVILANDQITIVRSTSLKGRVRIAKNDVLIGGVSLQLFLNGLEARVETVRHLVGGEALVFGGIFLSQQTSASVKYFGRTIVGSPRAVVEQLIAGHCAAEPALNLKSLAAELDGMFLPDDKLRAS